MNQDAHYDAVVIGAGPGGEVCAGRLGAADKRVAVVERERVGGECAFWACIPSKALLRSVDPYEQAVRVPGSKAAINSKPSFAQAAAWRTETVDGYDDGAQVPWLREHHVDLVRGDAQCQEPGVVRVGDKVLRCDNIVIATGSEPVTPPIEGLRDGMYWTTRDATAASSIPKRLIVLGGGAVGLEMGQVFARYGSNVTIVEAANQILASDNPQIGEILASSLRAEGITLELGRKAKSVQAAEGSVRLTLDSGKTLEADQLLVATGRKPRSENVDAAALNVKLQKGAVVVDQQCRAADGIYAVGDVTAIGMFTHVAKYQARIAADTILGKSPKANYDAVPRCLFTDPEVASVGLSEQQATERKIETVSTITELKEVARANVYYEKSVSGAVAFLADKQRKVLIGASIVGPLATEMIGFASAAIRSQIPLDTLRDIIQPFPTFAEAFFEGLSGLSV